MTRSPTGGGHAGGLDTGSSSDISRDAGRGRARSGFPGPRLTRPSQKDTKAPTRGIPQAVTSLKITPQTAGAFQGSPSGGVCACDSSTLGTLGPRRQGTSEVRVAFRKPMFVSAGTSGTHGDFKENMSMSWTAKAARPAQSSTFHALHPCPPPYPLPAHPLTHTPVQPCPTRPVHTPSSPTFLPTPPPPVPKPLPPAYRLQQPRYSNTISTAAPPTASTEDLRSRPLPAWPSQAQAGLGCSSATTRNSRVTLTLIHSVPPHPGANPSPPNLGNPDNLTNPTKIGLGQTPLVRPTPQSDPWEHGRHDQPSFLEVSGNLNPPRDHVTRSS
ncbi:DNA-directed RNA polymerase II subunit RPB1-like [Penaeus japonicus]|uniref:DNA-directed RNA polymerase II subunit RPB1-like n=1 Tax=Penaeus japonicus TaxID=27405 RepID=UPI001C7101DD|nr:DNA-directed RNA polymerase II subunit RPB1-like [Penaeus japonicus]